MCGCKSLYNLNENKKKILSKIFLLVNSLKEWHNSHTMLLTPITNLHIKTMLTVKDGFEPNKLKVFKYVCQE